MIQTTETENVLNKSCRLVNGTNNKCVIYYTCIILNVYY